MVDFGLPQYLIFEKEDVEDYADLNIFGYTPGNFVDVCFGYSCAADFESFSGNPFCFEGDDFEFGMSFLPVSNVCDCIDFDSFEIDKNFC